MKTWIKALSQAAGMPIRNERGLTSTESGDKDGKDDKGDKGDKASTILTLHGTMRSPDLPYTMKVRVTKVTEQWW